MSNKIKRSFGVTIFSLVLLILAIVIIINLIKASFFSHLYCALYELLLYDLILLAAAVLLIILSIGIWQLRNWARITCLWIAAIAGVYIFLFGLALGGTYGVTFDVIIESLLCSSLPIAPIIFFFTRPKVKKQFKQ